MLCSGEDCFKQWYGYDWESFFVSWMVEVNMWWILLLMICNVDFVPQLPSDATRLLEEEDFSPQVRDVSALRGCFYNLFIFLLLYHGEMLPLSCDCVWSCTSAQNAAQKADSEICGKTWIRAKWAAFQLEPIHTSIDFQYGTKTEKSEIHISVYFEVRVSADQCRDWKFIAAPNGIAKIMIFILTYNTVQMFGVCTIFVVFLNTNDAFI